MLRSNNALLVAFSAALPWMFPGAVRSAEGPARGEREEVSVPARLAILRNKVAAHPVDRTNNARALGQLTDAREVRDQQVVEALCRIATDPTDDLFVRMECTSALGELQYNVFADDYVRSQYTVPFVSILRDSRDDELLRARVAQVLGRTMPADRPQTQQAVNVMKDLAGDRNGSLLLRVASVDALAEIGAAAALVDLLGTVLPQNNLDPLLQERLLKAFADVLARTGTTEPLRLPDLIRIRELFLDPATPVEIRIVCMRALAAQKKAGYAKSIELMPEIRNILRTADDATLLVAAVEVAGVLDESDAVPLLADAYKDFFDAEKPDREADLKIRTAIVRTLGGLLNAQASKKHADGEAIRRAVEIFLQVIDPAEENHEVAGIREEAVFMLRYLYPKKAEFQRFHQVTIERLLTVAREGRQGDAEMPETIAETLMIISRYPGGKDLPRWEKWFAKTYPGAVVKAELP